MCIIVIGVSRNPAQTPKFGWCSCRQTAYNEGKFAVQIFMQNGDLDSFQLFFFGSPGWHNRGTSQQCSSCYFRRVSLQSIRDAVELMRSSCFLLCTIDTMTASTRVRRAFVHASSPYSRIYWCIHFREDSSAHRQYRIHRPRRCTSRL